MSADPLHAALKKHFGYDVFRPHQADIIRAALAGRDVFALLPTGGGKSLCFQLPALLRPGLTLVVSPLIALMKDQVDALQSAGIAATFLNSTLGAEEARHRWRELHAGHYKLLYVAPERLLLDGFLSAVAQWNVSLVAVDEAHCVSEWGHDFRPEYRQLAQLREKLPAVPWMALTATATDRVREDIVKQLRLREPACFTASFNRPNLSYTVSPKREAYRQLLAFVRERRGECGIVYCQSRKQTESVADKLAADGIAARPYHAGLAPEERARNQELFLRDDVQVVCATIAFGMGVNKPNVRFVVHYDLPKNIEGYYQETGRAGRDGLPAACLLLFSPGDVVKQRRFLDEISDPAERARTARQLDEMVSFAEDRACRRERLMGYFGETWTEIPCGGCDNCLVPRETRDGTVPAQKLLSCVERIRRHGGFGVGLAHVVDVLSGGDTEKVRKFGHQTLSTYGIGTEHSRQQWMAVGRELIRLGLLRADPDKFNTLELTAAGRDALVKRTTVELTQLTPTPVAKVTRAGQIECDEVLFDRLRVLRKRLADELSVPAYIVFGDTTLREMARDLPKNMMDLRRISGVGEKKLAAFGATFLEEIRAYSATSAVR
jgi:ATP-dependent DNA helicase RecQ